MIFNTHDKRRSCKTAKEAVIPECLYRESMFFRWKVYDWIPASVQSRLLDVPSIIRLLKRDAGMTCFPTIPKKLFKKALEIFIGVVLFFGFFPVFAADFSNPYLGEKSIQPSIVKESAEAIFGRAFGVQDERLEIDYNVFEFTTHSPGNSAFRSALVPGWGQAFNSQPTKGALVFSVFAIATVGSISRYNQSQNSYDEYVQAGVKDGSKYDDYKNQQTQAMILGGVAVGTWLFAMFDAYHHAYSPIWSKDNSLQLAFIPDAGNSLHAGVSWRRRF